MCSNTVTVQRLEVLECREDDGFMLRLTEQMGFVILFKGMFRITAFYDG